MGVTEREKAADAIAPGMSCEEAFGRIVEDCVIEIDLQLAVFLGSDHESGPHKTRVALRRLTTALDAFAPILRRKPAAAARAEAKAIFRLLGKVRDADVFLAAHGAGDRALLRETVTLRETTRAALRSRKAVTFAPGLSRMLTAGGLLKEKPRGLAARAAPVGDMAAGALGKAWATALACGPSPAALEVEALHDFRKDMKTLRYLSEFFAPVWPGDGWPPFREALQDLQDQLGLLNDFANARAKGRAPDPDKETRARTRADALWAELTAAGPFWTAAG